LLFYDGAKTKVLLRYFLDQGVEFTYTPVDISSNVLEILEENLLNDLPSLEIESFHGEYFDALNKMGATPEKDVVFFLGSNIGNFEGDTATDFLIDLHDHLNAGDLLFMGVDLKKDPSIILSAYNDKEGITKAFNLNLLSRINRELDGNFDVKNFIHYPYYNPQTGECRSYLISKKAQSVTIADQTIHFDAWESIFTEVSKKYHPGQLSRMAEDSGFTEIASFEDCDDWFTNILWKV
jgi:uncharacterized SAM-dependent methyltransferase